MSSYILVNFDLILYRKYSGFDFICRNYIFVKLDSVIAPVDCGWPVLKNGIIVPVRCHHVQIL